MQKPSALALCRGPGSDDNPRGPGTRGGFHASIVMRAASAVRTHEGADFEGLIGRSASSAEGPRRNLFGLYSRDADVSFVCELTRAGAIVPIRVGPLRSGCSLVDRREWQAQTIGHGLVS